MNYPKLIAYLVLVVGLAAILMVSSVCRMSLQEARADRDRWRDERVRLEARAHRAEKEFLTASEQKADERRALDGELDEARKGVADLQKQSGQLSKRVQGLAAEAKSLQAEKEKLRAAVEKLTKGRLLLDAENRTLREAAATLRQELVGAVSGHEKLEKALGEIRSLVEQLASSTATSSEKLMRGVEELQAVRTTSDRLATEITTLTGELRVTTNRLAKTELLAERYRLERDRLTLENRELSRGGPPQRTASPPNPKPEPGTKPKPPARPTIVATIAAVSDGDGVVVVNAGTKSGVVEGTLFSVYEGDTVVATIRAADLYADYTGCVIVTKRADAVIKKGLAARAQ